MSILKIIYWIGVVLEIAIRAPYQKKPKTAEKSDRRETRTEKILLGLLAIGYLGFPLIYSLTNWLDFANYRMPGGLGGLGVFLLACSVLLFYFAHRGLKSNWSPTVEIYNDHSLVTNGIYRFIRHPMYASQWVWCIAQILLLQNWLAGPIDLLCFIPFYFLRVPAEEKLMLDTFGEQYREYMKKVGGVIPK